MKVRTSWLRSSSVGALAALSLCCACASAPPLDQRGLPRISRYTNAAQLDFLLERYAVVAAEAATRDPDLLAHACLGYERTVFDLESLRRYPLLIRMSSEGAALHGMRAELQGALVRHPLPAACAPSAPVPPQPEVTAAAPAGDAGAATESGAPPSPEGVGTVSQGGGAVASRTGAVRSEGSAERERAQLAQLRRLLPPLAGDVTPEDAPPSAPPPLDEQALQALAESDLPLIRLRARYHQLGRCAQLVAAVDRYPTVYGVCAGSVVGEAPRQGQSRLVRSLLKAWRARYPEPLQDAVGYLVNVANRDNPMTDGARIGR